MVTRERVLFTLRALVDAVFWMLFGALLLTIVLEFANPPIGKQLHLIRVGLLAAWVCWNMLRLFLLPQQPQNDQLAGPSPKWSGLAVILAVGLTSAYGVRGDAVTAAIVVVVTAALALGLWHFAGKHEGEIGEARFNTTNH